MEEIQKTTVTINNQLLIDFASRSTSGFTPLLDEEGNQVAQTEEELNAEKLAYAKDKVLEEVLVRLVRAAEVDIRHEKMAEVNTAVNTIKSAAISGVTIN